MANVLITGTNRGIGLALTRHFIEQGDSVIATCRKPSVELRACAGVRIEAEVDITDSASLDALRERLGRTRLDVLFLNAGILESGGLADLDFESVTRQLEVNAVGPLRTLVALRPLLRRGSKVALMTSRMGSIADNTSGGSYGYRMSKAALNAAGKSLSIDLAQQGIAVAILHPGWVSTDMTRHSGNVDPDEAARGLIARVDALTLETSGTFWHADGSVLPW
ncbi:MAG: SDR family oxidoreductase [Myxococcales bacterium]|nr:SDR family oxidoreductase [Myxococcales bacterium]